jgi:hypothetical protein
MTAFFACTGRITRAEIPEHKEVRPVLLMRPLTLLC